MKIIFKKILASAFGFSLGLILIFYSFSFLTSKDFSKKLVEEIIIEREEISNFYTLFNEACEFRNEIEVPLNGERIFIRCENIESLEDFKKFLSSEIFQKFYFKSYECEFIECFSVLPEEEKPLLLFSFKANQFFSSILKISLLLSAVFGILILIIAKKWRERFRAIGFPFLLSGISFLALSYLLKTLIKAPTILKIFNLIETNISFLYFLFIGIGFILISSSFFIKKN